MDPNVRPKPQSPPSEPSGSPLRLPEEPEQRILEGLQGGNPEALESLYEDHADALLRYVVLPRLRDLEAAQDVVQEVFLTALDAGRRFRWRGRGFFSWLAGIARNQMRQRSRQKSEVPTPLEDLVASLSSPEEALRGVLDQEHRRELRQGIEATLEALTPRYAEVLRLRLQQRISRQEVARRLGLSLSHQDVLFHRALKAFRRQFPRPLAPPSRGGSS